MHTVGHGRRVPLHEIMDRKFHVNAAAHGGSDPLRS